MTTIKIKKEDLPPVDPSGAIVMRIRVVSKTRNDVSEWSQVYSICPTPIEKWIWDGNESRPITDGADQYFDQTKVYPINVTATKSADSVYRISVKWDDEYNLPKYDVFVGWITGYGNYHWQFLDTVSSKSYFFESDANDQVMGFVLAVTKECYVKGYNPTSDQDGGQWNLLQKTTPITVFNTIAYPTYF